MSGVLGKQVGIVALSSDSSECRAQSTTKSRKESEKAKTSKWKVWRSLPQIPLLNKKEGNTSSLKPLPETPTLEAASPQEPGEMQWASYFCAPATEHGSLSVSYQLVGVGK